MRGMWQDDTLHLRLARDFQGHGFLAALTPVVSPLRRLYTLPYRLALATPQPVWTQHLLYGAIWLGQALAAGWISRLLLPGRRLTRFLAICLTLTATSDYLTNNLTALGYNAGALLLLLAIGCSLRYVTSGSAGWIAIACAATAASIWTIDIAIPALPFIPLLLLWRGGTAAWRRILLVLSAVGIAIAPAVPIEWRFLHDRTSYAAVALVPMRLAERLHRTMGLWLENFAPWRWAFARPIWYPRPPAAIPLWAMGLAAAVAAAWFAFRARRAQDPDRPERPIRTLLLAGVFAAMALIANAAYAGLQMAELHYRTHILSRTWASLAVAVSAGWAVQQWPRFRTAFLLVPMLFVGFGVWGGLERQDLWVSTWRLHKKELLSIVTTAPALTPGTGIILRSPPTPDLYLATEADYLAQSWLILLYDDPAIHALRMASDRGTGCRATPDGLACWHEQQAGCFDAGTCAADRFPYETLVILDFDSRRGTWRLVSSPQGDPLLGGSAAALAGYRPAGRIVERPLTPRQRALLLE
jgi:MFS family permease